MTYRLRQEGNWFMLKYAQAKGGWNTIHIHMLMQDICLQGGGPYYLTLFSASQVLTQAAD